MLDDAIRGILLYATYFSGFFFQHVDELNCCNAANLRMDKTAKKRVRRKMRIYRLVALCVKHLLNKDMDYKRREEDRKVLSCAKVYHKSRQQGSVLLFHA